jgi:hypothetical protein
MDINSLVDFDEESASNYEDRNVFEIIDYRKDKSTLNAIEINEHIS